MKETEYVPIRVLIISDRLQNQAKCLSEQLSSLGVDVVGAVENRQEALLAVQNRPIDYLIIAGYLKNKSNYEVILDLQKQGKDFMSVQWAIIDSLIIRLGYLYRIQLRFERRRPITEFVAFLREHKKGSEF